MHRSSLKKLLAKRLPADILHSLETLSPGFSILDSRGKPLHRQPPADSPRADILQHSQPIGAVQGPGDPQAVARILSHLAELEAERRDVCQDALERYKELTFLYSLSEKITSSLDSRELARMILAEVREVFQVEQSILLFWDPAGKRFTQMASPEPGLPEEALAGMAQGVAGHVLSSGRAEVVNDLSRDDRWVEGAFPPGSLLCAPLQAKNATPGVLAAHSRKPGRFSAEDLSLFKTLAASAASALENARLYENLARAKEAAEAADRAKTEFLETLSHEIRTPLNAILGMTDLLHDSELDADQRKCLSVARQAGESLLAMINDILELIRLQVRSGKQDLAPKRFDLEELVEEACLAMAGKAQAKGLDMAYFIHPGLPTQLSGDPERLRQVLLCLLDNAVKFTEAGEVRIAVSKTRSKPNAVGAHTFRFSVTDTGPGIPESQHKTIFHRFTQADSSTTRRHGGAGVGLAIAKRLVELMGGRIRVKSEPGHGSTFNFTVKLGVSPAGGDQHLPAPELEGRRVLLADPAPASRDMLAQSLERLGLEVRSEPDVKKALELAEQAADGDAPWDAVLLDACRHEKEALRVGARIRELLPRTPLFLLLPRHDQTARIQRLARLGFENHLLKPVSPAPLRSRLLAALAGG